MTADIQDYAGYVLREYVRDKETKICISSNGTDIALVENYDRAKEIINRVVARRNK